MFTLIAYIIIGLIGGSIAKAIMPGEEGGGWVATAALGAFGALLAGWLGQLIFDSSYHGIFSIRGLVFSAGSRNARPDPRVPRLASHPRRGDGGPRPAGDGFPVHTRCRSVAHFVSWCRLLSWSFRSTDETWVSTVFMEMKSSRATSRYE